MLQPTIKAINLEERIAEGCYIREREGGCGLAVVRSVLDRQFGLIVEEDLIFEKVCEFYERQGNACSEEKFIKDGVSPSAIAHSLQELTRQPLKVFCSKQGSIFWLDYLRRAKGCVPILHTNISYQNEDNPLEEGHYLVYLGKKGGEITYFDPSVGEGVKARPPSEFLGWWYNHRASERWFLAAFLKEERIDSHYLKGKWLQV